MRYFLLSLLVFSLGACGDYQDQKYVKTIKTNCDRLLSEVPSEDVAKIPDNLCGCLSTVLFDSLDSENLKITANVFSTAKDTKDLENQIEKIAVRSAGTTKMLDLDIRDAADTCHN